MTEGGGRRDDPLRSPANTVWLVFERDLERPDLDLVKGNVCCCILFALAGHHADFAVSVGGIGQCINNWTYDQLAVHVDIERATVCHEGNGIGFVEIRMERSH